MAAAKHAQCVDCGQPIRWAQTTNGKPIPMMVGSDPDGVYVYTGPGLVRHLPTWERERHRVALALGTTKQQLFLPHVVACTARREREPVPEAEITKIRQLLTKPRRKEKSDD